MLGFVLALAVYIVVSLNTKSVSEKTLERHFGDLKEGAKKTFGGAKDTTEVSIEG